MSFLCEECGIKVPPNTSAVIVPEAYREQVYVNHVGEKTIRSFGYEIIAEKKCCAACATFVRAYTPQELKKAKEEFYNKPKEEHNEYNVSE